MREKPASTAEKDSTSPPATGTAHTEVERGGAHGHGAGSKVASIQNTIVEELLAEFNEGLRCEGKPHFEILDRCPNRHRRELLALFNVAALTYRALEPERRALRAVGEGNKGRGIPSSQS